MAEHYTLRMFEADKQVATSAVAIIPHAQSFPKVGETIGDKWKVTEILRSSATELHVRVERLQEADGR